MALELSLIAIIFFGGIFLHFLYRLSSKATLIESICTLKYLFTITTLGFLVGIQSQANYRLAFAIVLIYFHLFLAFIWTTALNLTFTDNKQSVSGA